MIGDWALKERNKRRSYKKVIARGKENGKIVRKAVSCQICGEKRWPAEDVRLARKMITRYRRS